jgi:hypothetical protein
VSRNWGRAHDETRATEVRIQDSRIYFHLAGGDHDDFEMVVDAFKEALPHGVRRWDPENQEWSFPVGERSEAAAFAVVPGLRSQVEAIRSQLALF